MSPRFPVGLFIFWLYFWLLASVAASYVLGAGPLAPESADCRQYFSIWFCPCRSGGGTQGLCTRFPAGHSALARAGASWKDPQAIDFSCFSCPGCGNPKKPVKSVSWRVLGLLWFRPESTALGSRCEGFGVWRCAQVTASRVTVGLWLSGSPSTTHCAVLGPLRHPAQLSDKPGS